MNTKREKALRDEETRTKEHVGHTIRFNDVVGDKMREGVLVRVSREPNHSCLLWLELGATFPRPIYLERVHGCITCEANQPILPVWIADCPKECGGLMHWDGTRGEGGNRNVVVNWYTCDKCGHKALPTDLELREKV